MEKKKTESKAPFFARFLVTQELRDVSGGARYITLKYPSDRDEFVTMKYPSDDDEVVSR
ncbi:MAG: microviridin/marinostatin family tricyclic proteinase inhibitor [Deltaproteobacteria bacterium]|nr:microviridin/marinostatin family tricyclic proteinase inhibitor [Deltaproteobacteria bacterium]